MNNFEIKQTINLKIDKLFVFIIFSILFASCSNKNIITNPITGEKVLVAQKDFEGLHWKDAQNRCKELGEGWRLPTIDELEVMYIKKDDLKLDVKNVYFSSSYTNIFEKEIEVNCLDFRNGYHVLDTINISDKGVFYEFDFLKSSRAVKTIK